jgi:hypothetical protein
MKMLFVASICQKAFVFMIKEATVADTRPAGVTIEFVAVANLVPALSAFYGSIDQLKHRNFVFHSHRSKTATSIPVRHLPLSTVSSSRAMKKLESSIFRRLAKRSAKQSTHRDFRQSRTALPKTHASP